MDDAIEWLIGATVGVGVILIIIVPMVILMFCMSIELLRQTFPGAF